MALLVAAKHCAPARVNAELVDGDRLQRKGKPLYWKTAHSCARARVVLCTVSVREI